MASFYLDECVAVIVAPYLRSLGHVVRTARDSRLLSACDGKHLLAAAEAGAICVSHNKKDYLMLHRAWLCLTKAEKLVLTHAGVAIADTMPAEILAHKLHELVQDDKLPLANELYYYKAPPDEVWVEYGLIEDRVCSLDCCD